MSSYADVNAYYPRSLAPSLEEDMRLYPVVAVMGARQVGKSTLCRELAERHSLPFRTLDESDVRKQAEEDPEGLLEDLGENGAFLDEVQRAPSLLLAIKTVVDRDKSPGRYLLSGSNQPHISQTVGDSLLGRAAYRTLRPLSLSELRLTQAHPGWSFLFADEEATIIKEFERRLAISGQLRWQEIVATGGFPKAVSASPAQRVRLLDDYVRVFANRDIREILGIESSDRFESFLRLVATRTGQVLNVASMATDLGAPVTTIRRWFDALSRSYLVETIPPYSRNAGQRVIRAPKLFMVDSALAMAAGRESSPTGFHLETLIATDLLIWRDNSPLRGLYHWRLDRGQEVDFVLEEDSRLVPVEVKASNNVGSDDAKHIRRFRDLHANARRGFVLSSDPEIKTLAPGIINAPWWAVI